MPYKKAWQRLSESLSDANTAMGSLPIVELSEDRRLLIENHSGITEYGNERICVKMKYGLLCVVGCGMELAKMTKEQLVITGKIDAITLQRRGQI